MPCAVPTVCRCGDEASPGGERPPANPTAALGYSSCDGRELSRGGRPSGGRLRGRESTRPHARASAPDSSLRGPRGVRSRVSWGRTELPPPPCGGRGTLRLLVGAGSGAGRCIRCRRCRARSRLARAWHFDASRSWMDRLWLYVEYTRPQFWQCPAVCCSHCSSENRYVGCSCRQWRSKLLCLHGLLQTGQATFGASCLLMSPALVH